MEIGLFDWRRDPSQLPPYPQDVIQTINRMLGVNVSYQSHITCHLFMPSPALEVWKKYLCQHDYQVVEKSDEKEPQFHTGLIITHRIPDVVTQNALKDLAHRKYIHEYNPVTRTVTEYKNNDLSTFLSTTRIKISKAVKEEDDEK